MKKRPRVHYDSVLKDLFQRDGPTLLKRLTGGLAVREVLNIEFSLVEPRRADLVLRLEDGSILHLEFQSFNDKDMPYRMGIYGFFIGRKYHCRVRQVVLYVGPRRMLMEDHVDLGESFAKYRLIDLRELDAEELVESGCPGDYALAMLARGGPDKLREIIKTANRLEGPARDRVLAQIGALSGLRQLSTRFKIECRVMGIGIDIEKNEFLMDIWTSGVEKGIEQGIEQGKEVGQLRMLCDLLETKFGPLPKWARERLAKPTSAQVNRWAKKILTAETLESVFGRR